MGKKEQIVTRQDMLSALGAIAGGGINQYESVPPETLQRVIAIFEEQGACLRNMADHLRKAAPPNFTILAGMLITKPVGDRAGLSDKQQRAALEALLSGNGHREPKRAVN